MTSDAGNRLPAQCQADASNGVRRLPAMILTVALAPMATDPGRRNLGLEGGGYFRNNPMHLLARCRGRQSASGRALYLHRPQHACGFGRAFPGAAGVVLIAIHRSVVIADQPIHRGRVVLLVTPTVCASPLRASTPMCAFMPKYHCCHDDRISGSCWLAAFLEGDAAICIGPSSTPEMTKRVGPPLPLNSPADRRDQAIPGDG